jgi:hypothetical protein
MGEDANKLLKVVWRGELMTIREFEGRAALVRERVAGAVSPTYPDEAAIEHVMVFGLTVSKPVLEKAVPDAEALTWKLVAYTGFVTVTERA